MNLAYHDENEQKKMVNISLPIDANVHRLIKTHAAIRGKNVRDIIRECIESVNWKDGIVEMVR